MTEEEWKVRAETAEAKLMAAAVQLYDMRSILPGNVDEAESNMYWDAVMATGIEVDKLPGPPYEKYENLLSQLDAMRVLAAQLYETLDLELRCHFMCDVCHAPAEGRDRTYSHPYAMHCDYDPKTMDHRAGCPVAIALVAYADELQKRRA